MQALDHNLRMPRSELHRPLAMNQQARAHRLDAWRALFDAMAARRLSGRQQSAAIAAMVDELMADDSRPCEALVRAVLP